MLSRLECEGHVIHIADEKDDKMVDDFLMIQRNDIVKSIFPLVSDSNELLRKEWNAVEVINGMSTAQKDDLKKAINDYQKSLDQNSCKDLGIAQIEKYNFVNTIVVVLGFLPYMIGVLLNGLPLWFAKYFADKKVKKIEFHSSVRYGAGLFSYLIYWLLFFILSLVSGNPIFRLTVILAPFLGFFSLFYEDLAKKWKAARNFNSQSSAIQKDLQVKRSTIFKILEKEVIQSCEFSPFSPANSSISFDKDFEVLAPSGFYLFSPSYERIPKTFAFR